MIQYGWTVMYKELRGHDISETQGVESLRYMGKEYGLQPVGGTESWSLIRERMGQTSTDSNMTPEAAARIL